MSAISRRLTLVRSADRAPEPALDALARGEPAAVRECYRQHADAIRAFAFRLTGDAEVASDLTQDVFVALPDAIRRFRGEGSLRSYLVSIAANQARRHVRRAARRRQDPTLGEGPSGRPGPEQRAYERQLAAELSRAMDGLPIKLRVAFVMVTVEGYTSVEAARLLGVPEGTVRSRVSRAKAALRARLTRRGIRDGVPDADHAGAGDAGGDAR